MAAPEKLCTVCGTDVAGKKRVKDTQGNYFCETCYAAKTAAAKKPRELAGASAAGMKAGGVYDLPELPPAPAAEDGLLDLAPEVKPAKKENMFGCAGCKKLVPERQIRNVEGEFICGACFAKRNGGGKAPAKSRTISDKDREEDENKETWKDTLSGGLVIAAGVVVVTFFVLFGLNMAMPESKEYAGTGMAVVMAGVATVFVVLKAGALMGSMLLAANIMGGISFGFVGPVIYKSLTLFSAFTLLDFFVERNESLVMMAMGFRGILLLLGFIVMFRVDYFEAMLLSVINFFVGWGLAIGMAVMVLHMASWLGHGPQMDKDFDEEMKQIQVDKQQDAIEKKMEELKPEGGAPIDGAIPVEPRN